MDEEGSSVDLNVFKRWSPRAIVIRSASRNRAGQFLGRAGYFYPGAQSTPRVQRFYTMQPIGTITRLTTIVGITNSGSKKVKSS